MATNKRLQKALALAAEVLGKPVEIPIESMGDLMAQGQAVLNYFQARSEFKQKECWECTQTFAYCWDRDGILYCSVPCMAKALERKGMSWDSSKPPEKRWGKTIPAVVPPEALALIPEPEPTEPDDIDALLAEFE